MNSSPNNNYSNNPTQTNPDNLIQIKNLETEIKNLEENLTTKKNQLAVLKGTKTWWPFSGGKRRKTKKTKSRRTKKQTRKK